jgi:hypothetical protein
MAMSNSSKKFGFRIEGVGAAAVAHVTIAIDDGEIDLTPSLTAEEIDTHVAMLKVDLDAVDKRAKAALDRARGSDG